MSLLVVGSVALDTVKSPFGKNIDAIGGSAVYASVSASYFTDVKLVGVVGEDFPEKYLKLIKEKGIDTQGLQIRKGKTFRWKGEYNQNLDVPKTISTQLNVFENFSPKLPESYKNCEVIFLANIDPQLQLDVLSQAKRPKLVAADTIDFWIRRKRKKLLEVLKKIDIFTINESEARLLTGEQNLIKAGKVIVSYGSPKVVIKKGEHGLICVMNKGFFASPAYPVEAIYDPTGAGDSFAGGFLGYLTSCKKKNFANFKKSLIYGSVMASYDVEGFDLRLLSRLNMSQIERRFEQFKNFLEF